MAVFAQAAIWLAALVLQTAPVEGLFHVTAGTGDNQCGYAQPGTPEADRFFAGGPQSFRIGTDGFFYLTDPLKNRILKFDAMGSLAQTIRPADRPDFTPTDFALDAASNLVCYDHATHRIVVIDSAGRILRVVDAPYENGNFGYAEWIETTEAGVLCVKDRDRGAIVVIGPDGAALGGVRTEAPSFAVDRAGNLFYAERDASSGFSLWVYSLGKKPLRLLKIGYPERAAARVTGLDADGRILLILDHAEAGSERTLLSIDASGMVDFERPLPRIQMIRPIHLTSTGTIYFAGFDAELEKGAFRIYRFK